MSDVPTAEQVRAKFMSLKGMSMQKAARVQKAVFFEVARRVINKTPVDTGRARGGWHADVDVYTPAPAEFTGSGDAAADAAMASVQEAIKKHTTGQSLTLGNGVKYIRYLNDGSSKQAPNGMTDEAINELGNLVEVASREEL